MKGREHLKNLKDRTTDEQREIAQKGGIASGESRRKKKAMREAAEMVLGLTPPTTKKQQKHFEQLGLGSDEAVDLQLMSLLAIAVKATTGDIQALQFLRDTAGEKPEDKIQVREEPPVIVDDINEQS